MKYFDAIAKEWKFGDIVSAVVTPIAGALGHPCVDRQTGKLKKGSKCDERRKRMNGDTGLTRQG